MTSPYIGLFLGSVWNDDAPSTAFLLLDSTKQHTIMKRAEIHGYLRIWPVDRRPASDLRGQTMYQRCCHLMLGC